MSRTRRVFTILCLCALLAAGIVMLREMLRIKIRVTGWKPGFCATMLSKDNVPLAVCSDRFYPVYSDVPDGYLGRLEGCIITERANGCRPSTQ